MRKSRLIEFGNTSDHRVVMQQVPRLWRWLIGYQLERRSIIGAADDHEANRIEANLAGVYPALDLLDFVDDPLGILRLVVSVVFGAVFTNDEIVTPGADKAFADVDHHEAGGNGEPTVPVDSEMTRAQFIVESRPSL